mgnify:CR=1 FL=1
MLAVHHISSLVSSLGSFLGSSIGGAVIRHYGEIGCYRLSAIIVMSGLGVYLTSLWLPPQGPTTEKHSALKQEKVENPHLHSTCLGRPV